MVVTNFMPFFVISVFFVVKNAVAVVVVLAVAVTDFTPFSVFSVPSVAKMSSPRPWVGLLFPHAFSLAQDSHAA